MPCALVAIILSCLDVSAVSIHAPLLSVAFMNLYDIFTLCVFLVLYIPCTLHMLYLPGLLVARHSLYFVDGPTTCNSLLRHLRNPADTTSPKTSDVFGKYFRCQSRPTPYTHTLGGCLSDDYKFVCYLLTY